MQPVHQGLKVCTEDAITCVPESLYMFLWLMLGGQSLLENGLSDGNDDGKEDDDNFINNDDDDKVNDDEGNDHGTDAMLLTKKENSLLDNKTLRLKNKKLGCLDLVYSVSGGEGGHPKTLILAAVFIKRRGPRNWKKCFIMGFIQSATWMSVESIPPLPSTRFQQ